MKAGCGVHFKQAYNAQAAVEVNTRLIVSQASDKEQLAPTSGHRRGAGCHRQRGASSAKRP